MKKKILLAVTAVAMAAALCFMCKTVTNQGNSDFSMNLEALADGEISVGPMCAWSPGWLCITYFPDGDIEILEDFMPVI